MEDGIQQPNQVGDTVLLFLENRTYVYLDNGWADAFRNITNFLLQFLLNKKKEGKKTRGSDSYIKTDTVLVGIKTSKQN